MDKGLAAVLSFRLCLYVRYITCNNNVNNCSGPHICHMSSMAPFVLTPCFILDIGNLEYRMKKI